VWEHLLPGLSDAPLPGPYDADLDAFLSARTLPTLRSSVPPTRGRHELVATGSAAAMVSATSRVVLDADGLTLDDGTGPVTVPLGDGVWQRGTATVDGRTVEVAGTGGWTAPGVLEARLVPLHSPHVLEVTVDLNTGTAVLEWQTTPLWNVSLARRAF